MKTSFAENAIAQSAGRFTPEFELLLCSARTLPDAARMQALIDSGIDWNTFQYLAEAHSVRLLVYKALRHVCWERVPAQSRTEWHETYQALTGKNLFLTGELLRITEEFQAADIPIAVMKGPVLAEMAYGDFTLREFSDLDLLIRPQDFSPTLDLLQQLGYDPFWKYEHSKMLRFLEHVGEYRLTREDWDTHIDLHWRVATKATALSPSVDDFPSGFQPVPVAGSTVLSFAPQDLPLYLAAQGGWDQWSDLKRICDLAEFLRRYPQLDWEPHLRSAQRLDGLRSMLAGLALASELLGAPVPEHVLHAARADSSVAALAQSSLRRLLHNLESGEAVSRYLFQLRAKEGVRAKISLGRSILMDRTAEDAGWLMLPRPLWWLYAFLRPLRMSRTLLRVPWN